MRLCCSSHHKASGKYHQKTPNCACTAWQASKFLQKRKKRYTSASLCYSLQLDSAEFWLHLFYKQWLPWEYLPLTWARGAGTRAALRSTPQTLGKFIVGSHQDTLPLCLYANMLYMCIISQPWLGAFILTYKTQTWRFSCVMMNYFKNQKAFMLMLQRLMFYIPLRRMV